jgi:DNA-binding NarL/FixJ family response regulator
MIRICIVDDHTLFRHGIKQVLSENENCELVNEAATGKELLVLLPECTWDLLIVDMSLQDMNGIELIKAVKKKNTDLPILVLSMHNEEQYGCAALKAGAAGYITKDAAPSQLMQAIKKVSSGGKYLTTNLAEHIVDTLHQSNKDSHGPAHSRLSEREMQVLLKLASGQRLIDIAKQLKLSVKTISTYRARLFEKMGLKNNSDLIHYCIQYGLIDISLQPH